MFPFYPQLQPSTQVQAPCRYPGCDQTFPNQESRMKHLWATHLAPASIMQTALFTCYECHISFPTELDKSNHMSTHPGLKAYTIGDFQKQMTNSQYTAHTSIQRQRDRMVCHQPPAGSQTTRVEDVSLILVPFLFCPVQDCPSTSGFSSEPSWKRHKNKYHPNMFIEPIRRENL